jgi:hypothetical protein
MIGAECKAPRLHLSESQAELDGNLRPIPRLIRGTRRESLLCQVLDVNLFCDLCRQRISLICYGVGVFFGILSISVGNGHVPRLCWYSRNACRKGSRIFWVTPGSLCTRRAGVNEKKPLLRTSCRECGLATCPAFAAVLSKHETVSKRRPGFSHPLLAETQRASDRGQRLNLFQ